MGNQGGVGRIELLGAHGSDGFFIAAEDDVVEDGIGFIPFKSGIFKGEGIVVLNDCSFGLLCVDGAIGDRYVA